MIVNLSYKDGFSVNHFSRKEECTVQYNDIDAAVEMIRKIHEKHGQVFLTKCDGKSAFRQIPVSRRDYPLLVMKAEDPETGEMCYFIDKVVVFGSSQSCRLFSEFAQALAHILHHLDKHGQKPNEYLDDVLTGGSTPSTCDESLINYLEVCRMVNFPITEDKTVWATQVIVFLGLLLNTITMTLSIPVEKKDDALNQIQQVLCAKKIRMQTLQRLAGLLNFLSRAIVPGRTFIRRLYDKMVGIKPHHHLRVDQDIKSDLLMWKQFLKLDTALCRPFMDFHQILQADTLDFYSDASKSQIRAGFGVVFGRYWTYQEFPPWVVQDPDIAIHTLELYAVLIGVALFSHKLKGRRVEIFCDNQAVVAMINKGTSKCKTCMRFIRSITFISMQHQVRYFAKYVKSLENTRADALSRLDLAKFWRSATSDMERHPLALPSEFWPVHREWWLGHKL